MLTIEQAREILRLDTADNDAIIEGLLSAIPDYIELILMLWYNAERADAEKLQRTIDSLLKTLALIAVRKE